MNSCNECGRFQCDCEVMILDIYDTEIVGGEKHFENDYGELIHPSNLEKYGVEYWGLKLKTR